MTRVMTVSLVTVGDPSRMTGGYLYHLKMARAAPAHDAGVVFVSIPDRVFPLAVADAPAALRRAEAGAARALVLDSIAAAFLGPWLAARPPSVPVVGSLHQPPGGIDHGPLRTRLQAALDRLAYRRACLLLVASTALAQQLRSLGFPAEQLRVVPPGRDVVAGVEPTPHGTREVARHRADLRRGRRAAFVCVGNWVPRKGILELLEAFAQLPPDAATLHLVGDSEADPRYAARVRRRISSPDIHERAVVHGVLGAEEVASLYRTADAFVLASYKEPYGTVYGEAMAAGLPVVGWSAGNLPHLADDNREGLLVPPGAVADLARALERLANEEGFRRSLGEAAYRRALSRPTWDESAQLYFSFIREAVDAWSGKSAGSVHRGRG